MRIELTIEIPDNFKAEDSLWNDFQSEAMLDDLICVPIRNNLWEYLCTNYGRMLGIEVIACLEK